MDSQTKNMKAISVKKLQEDEKLPKEIVVRNLDEERGNGITDLKCAIFRDYTTDRYTNLKVNGEICGRMSRYTIMMFLVYNGNGELIEANYDEEIDDHFRGRKTFSQTLQVPRDEFISRVLVRFIPDPVFL